MKNYGAVLQRKFTSEKPSSGSKLFASSFGDLMRKTMPTDKPSTEPPDSSYKETNQWIYDKERGVYFKFFWKDGVPRKILKKPPWMILPWTIG